MEEYGCDNGGRRLAGLWQECGSNAAGTRSSVKRAGSHNREEVFVSIATIEDAKVNKPALNLFKV